MARLPVDPRLAAMLVAEGPLGCLQEMLIIVAALAVQDVRERPAEKAGRGCAHEKLSMNGLIFLVTLSYGHGLKTTRNVVEQGLAKSIAREFRNPCGCANGVRYTVSYDH